MGKFKEEPGKLRKGLSMQSKDCLSLFSEVQKMPYYSQGVILLKQLYNALLTHPDQPDFPSLENIEIVVGNFEENSFGNEVVTRLVVVRICVDRIELYIKGELEGTILADEDEYYIPSSDSDNATLQARRLLEKKIWVKICNTTNSIEINVGDILNNSEIQASEKKDARSLSTKIKAPQTLKKSLVSSSASRQAWYVSQRAYDISKHNLVPDKNDLQFLDFIQITWNGKLTQLIKAEQSGVLTLCHKVQVSPITRIYNSSIGKNPSILTKDGNLEDMEKPIQTLFGYIENTSISQLPRTVYDAPFTGKSYENFRSLEYAIDSSIRESYQYITYVKDGKTIQQPINVLSHLLKLKLKDTKGIGYTKLNNRQPKDKLLNQILNERQFNIRLQLQEAEGIAPGSIAVLEIWPPYTSSPIHNHSDCYGVLKVLAGEIRVQNFTDLNFLGDTNIPYKSEVYQKNDISWLSENSYSIHRMVNSSPTTCICIQAYYGQLSSKQYIQFVNKTQSAEQYCLYYPQHDWGDYLRWTTKEETEQAKFDAKFVKDVIAFYGLQVDGKIIDSFPSFVHVMKSQFQVLDPLSDLK